MQQIPEQNDYTVTKNNISLAQPCDCCYSFNKLRYRILEFRLQRTRDTCRTLGWKKYMRRRRIWPIRTWRSLHCRYVKKSPFRSLSQTTKTIFQEKIKMSSIARVSSPFCPQSESSPRHTTSRISKITKAIELSAGGHSP